MPKLEWLSSLKLIQNNAERGRPCSFYVKQYLSPDTASLALIRYVPFLSPLLSPVTGVDLPPYEASSKR
jgi:hypothetical protein